MPQIITQGRGERYDGAKRDEKARDDGGVAPDGREAICAILRVGQDRNANASVVHAITTQTKADKERVRASLAKYLSGRPCTASTRSPAKPDVGFCEFRYRDPTTVASPA